jgi:hypothetical protein
MATPGNRVFEWRKCGDSVFEMRQGGGSTVRAQAHAMGAKPHARQKTKPSSSKTTKPTQFPGNQKTKSQNFSAGKFSSLFTSGQVSWMMLAKS